MSRHHGLAIDCQGHPNWLHSALTDEEGQFDIAYIGVAALIIIVLGSIPTLLLMVGWAQWHHTPFDPQPVGIAIASISGGFATALAALAAYMAATRPRSLPGGMQQPQFPLPIPNPTIPQPMVPMPQPQPCAPGPTPLAPPYGPTPPVTPPSL